MSSFFAAIGLFAMGTHGYLKSQHVDVSAINWIPVASLSFVIFIASVGLLPLTFVILSEILPPKVFSCLFFFGVLIRFLIDFSYLFSGSWSWWLDLYGVSVDD